MAAPLRSSRLSALENGYVAAKLTRPEHRLRSLDTAVSVPAAPGGYYALGLARGQAAEAVAVIGSSHRGQSFSMQQTSIGSQSEASGPSYVPSTPVRLQSRADDDSESDEA